MSNSDVIIKIKKNPEPSILYSIEYSDNNHGMGYNIDLISVNTGGGSKDTDTFGYKIPNATGDIKTPNELNLDTTTILALRELMEVMKKIFGVAL